MRDILSDLDRWQKDGVSIALAIIAKAVDARRKLNQPSTESARAGRSRSKSQATPKY